MLSGQTFRGLNSRLPRVNWLITHVWLKLPVNSFIYLTWPAGSIFERSWNCSTGIYVLIWCTRPTNEHGMNESCNGWWMDPIVVVFLSSVHTSCIVLRARLQLRIFNKFHLNYDYKFKIIMKGFGLIRNICCFNFKLLNINF